VFDHAGGIRAVVQKEFQQFYPRPGWVEHDPMEIWQTQLATANAALAKAGLRPTDIAGIGITNQRETTLLWDRQTGAPVYPAIVWQDRRTSAFCDELKHSGAAERIQERTGLVVDAYFAGSKLRWLLDHVTGARERAQRGELAFGTVDTWLLWQLSGGKLHVTDATNASRTMFYNLRTSDWDDEMLGLLRVPREVLPEIRGSSEILGETATGLFDTPLALAGVAGDQQAALFGQNCFTRGLAKNTYGTGCFMLMNIGETPAPSKHKLLTTVAWKIGDKSEFALEGSVFIGGAVVQWLRDGLGIIKSAAEVETLAATVPDCGGVYLVPAFAGLGAPHWDQYARGMILGLTRGTTSGHLARAALEGIALQVADVLEVMKQDSGLPINELRVDGGASANSMLMQFQADVLQVPVVRPKVIETTALGAAYLAGLATGFWKNRDEIHRAWEVERTFEPRMSPDVAAHRRQRWAEALSRARGWEEQAKPGCGS
jgi:glycerol kinase